MQPIQEHEAVADGEVCGTQALGVERDVAELSPKPAVEKIIKVLVGIPLKGHTPPKSYHDRMLMFKYLGAQETIDFYEKKSPRYSIINSRLSSGEWWR